ncbi:hypothetical protein Ancab_018777 [Ancistrocladus abbreviatus]
METVNFPASPATPKTTNPTTSIPPNSSIKLKLLNLYPVNRALPSNRSAIILNPGKRSTSLFLTLCSTKPDTTTDGNPAAEFDSDTNSTSNAHQQNQAETASNQLLSSSSSFPSAAQSRGLVFDLGLKESWDGVEIGSPVVKRFLSDDEERWYMWYHGRSNKNPDTDSIGLAISSNGIHWERGKGAVQSSTDVGLVMKCGGDWWAFDTKSIRPSEVMIMSSTKVRAASAVYWLYYTGFSSEEVELSDSVLAIQNPEKLLYDNDIDQNFRIRKAFKSLPGLAISQDGRNWARIEGEHHSGALFDVGLEGEWDSLFVASPHVVFHNTDDLRMYYHSFDLKNKKLAIGIARSRDGIKWVKLGKIMEGGTSGGFDELGVRNACVVRNKKIGNYLMAYEAVAADGRSCIGLAVSADGLKDWRRVGDGAVLKPSLRDGWDSEGVGSPCLVQMEGNEDGGWRLYYRGIGEGGRTGIGMAVSEGRKLELFRRWVGFLHF